MSCDLVNLYVFTNRNWDSGDSKSGFTEIDSNLWESQKSLLGSCTGCLDIFNENVLCLAIVLLIDYQFQKMWNSNCGTFKYQSHGKLILGDKKLWYNFFSSTIANKDFPLELHIKLMLTVTQFCRPNWWKVASVRSHLNFLMFCSFCWTMTPVAHVLAVVI